MTDRRPAGSRIEKTHRSTFDQQHGTPGKILDFYRHDLKAVISVLTYLNS